MSAVIKDIFLGILSSPWTYAVVKLILVVVLFICLGYWVVFKNPIFSVTKIDSQQKIPNYISNSLYGHNIFSISIADLYNSLKEAFPLAKQITIQKILPATIKITVVNREPVVFIRKNGKIYPVDDEAVVLKPSNSLPRDVIELRIDSDVKLQVGKILDSEAVFSALELLRALKETGLFDLFDFEYIDALQPYELRLKIRKGPIWKLRGGKYKEKLELFKERLLKSFLEDLPHLSENSYLLFLDDGTITVNP